MARLLVFTEQRVENSARELYLRALSERRSKAKSTGANFWAFERINNDGHFLEFTEAASVDDIATVTPGAHALALWREVEGL